ALRLGHEVNVPYTASLEGYRPIWVVVADWSRDQETSWEFGIDNDLAACIQLLHEISFDIGIGDGIVVDVVLELLRGSGKILASLVRGENVHVVPLIHFVIGKALNHHGRLLL